MVYPALLPLMRLPRLPVVDWIDALTDINGLVRFAERRNLVYARMPSHFKRSLHYWIGAYTDISLKCTYLSSCLSFTKCRNLKFVRYFGAVTSVPHKTIVTCGTVWLCHYSVQCDCVIICHSVVLPLFSTVWLCHYLAQRGCDIIWHSVVLTLFGTAWLWHYLA